jgi:hypothetical protein
MDALGFLQYRQQRMNAAVAAPAVQAASALRGEAAVQKRSGGGKKDAGKPPFGKDRYPASFAGRKVGSKNKAPNRRQMESALAAAVASKTGDANLINEASAPDFLNRFGVKKTVITRLANELGRGDRTMVDAMRVFGDSAAKGGVHISGFSTTHSGELTYDQGGGSARENVETGRMTSRGGGPEIHMGARENVETGKMTSHGRGHEIQARANAVLPTHIGEPIKVYHGGSIIPEAGDGTGLDDKGKIVPNVVGGAIAADPESDDGIPEHQPQVSAEPDVVNELAAGAGGLGGGGGPLQPAEHETSAWNGISASEIATWPKYQPETPTVRRTESPTRVAPAPTPIHKIARVKHATIKEGKKQHKAAAKQPLPKEPLATGVSAAVARGSGRPHPYLQVSGLRPEHAPQPPLPVKRERGRPKRGE